MQCKVMYSECSDPVFEQFLCTGWVEWLVMWQLSCRNAKAGKAHGSWLQAVDWAAIFTDESRSESSG